MSRTSDILGTNESSIQIGRSATELVKTRLSSLSVMYHSFHNCKWLLRIKAHHEMCFGLGVLCMQSTFEFLVNLTCQPPLLNGCAITQ